MSDERTPARRSDIPARPRLTPRTFWSSPETEKVRGVENRAALAKYEAEIGAVVDRTKRDIEVEATAHMLDNAAKLADTAASLADNELKAKMMGRILEGWTEGQVKRLNP